MNVAEVTLTKVFPVQKEHTYDGVLTKFVAVGHGKTVCISQIEDQPLDIDIYGIGRATVPCGTEPTATTVDASRAGICRWRRATSGFRSSGCRPSGGGCWFGRSKRPSWLILLVLRPATIVVSAAAERKVPKYFGCLMGEQPLL